MLYTLILSSTILLVCILSHRHALCKKKTITSDYATKSSLDLASDYSNTNSYYQPQQQQEWSIELTPESPVSTSSNQLDPQYSTDNNQIGSIRTTDNLTDVRDFIPMNKWQGQNEAILDKYLSKIHRLDANPQKKNDHFIYQKPQTTKQYINSTQRVINDLYRLTGIERRYMNTRSKFQGELPVQFKPPISYMPPLTPSQKQIFYDDDFTRLIDEHNKASSQKYITKLAMTLPSRTSLSELLWLSDQGPTRMLPYTTKHQAFYPVVDIIPGSKLFGIRNKADIRWDEPTSNNQNYKLQHKLGNFIKGKSSRIDGDINVNFDTPDESIKYHIMEDYGNNYFGESPYKPSIKNHKREDDSSMVMQGSHYSHHHYEPQYSMSPYYYNKGFVKKSSLEKAGYSILIGSIAALISFLIISNIFLSIPLFAMTIMQIFQPNNQVFPLTLPNTNSNQQGTQATQPAQLVGKRRKKREVSHSLRLLNQSNVNLDDLASDLSRIIGCYHRVEKQFVSN